MGENKRKNSQIEESFLQVSEFETKEKQIGSKNEELEAKMNQVNQELEKSQNAKDELEKLLKVSTFEITELKDQMSKFEKAVFEKETNISQLLQDKNDLTAEMKQ